MRLQSMYTVPQATDFPPLLLSQAQNLSHSSSPSSSHLNSPHHKRLPFGIAFDIDGVVLHCRKPIGGSRRAIRRLYHDDDSGTMKIPFLFLTNGGGVPETKRALELSEVLGVKILPSQVVQGHSSFRNLLGRYRNELIVATGKGEPALVMSEYGFNKVLSLDEYASYFKDIDPVSRYKNWTTMSSTDGHNTLKRSLPVCDVYTETVKAAFVVSDPVDWGRDIQVLCDILRTGRFPGQKSGDQPPLYFAADDLEYQVGSSESRTQGMILFRTHFTEV